MAKVDQNMDNKIVLELIKKDIEELKILVETLQQTQNPQQLLIDIAKAKAKTLLQEFELLNAENATSPAKTIEVKQPVVVPIEEEIIEAVSTVVEKIEEPEVQPEEPVELQEREENIQEETIVEEELPAVAEIIETTEPQAKIEIREEPVKEVEFEIEPAASIITEEEELHEVVEEIIEQPIEEPAAKEEVPDENPVKSEVLVETESTIKKVFGEQFVKEQSLHDKLTSEKPVESKIKGKPITSLKAAIGLNDKFMFTRELFANNHDNFNNAVTTLDNCENLMGAIEYLEQNYTWAKNEVSIKFMELVKRRFEN